MVFGKNRLEKIEPLTSYIFSHETLQIQVKLISLIEIDITYPWIEIIYLTSKQFSATFVK